MSTIKQVNSKTSREAKRARFQEKPGGASPLILLAGLAIVLALIGGALFAFTSSAPSADELVAQPPPAGLSNDSASSQDLFVTAATLGHAPYPLVLPVGGAVRLALSTFDDYKAHHYTYMHEGRAIEFFVLKSKDGVVRAAFNACDVCFQSRKGYTQDGDYVVCGNCGQRFPADEINDVHGGCNPSPLTRVVEGDTLVIQVEDIARGLDYF